MPSPFPGMNPYLERDDVWQDFHQSLIPLIREVLTAQVRPAFVVKVEEYLFIDVERHSYLEIRNREGHELVTVLELLSPANKRPGPDREQYMAKRRQLIASPVHLVEIDLLRSGPRLPVEGLGECDYYLIRQRTLTQIS